MPLGVISFLSAKIYIAIYSWVRVRSTQTQKDIRQHGLEKVSIIIWIIK